MTEVVSLERILKAAEMNKDLFKHPLTISFQNEDITIKYIIAMLGIVESKEQRQIIKDFCNRFEADERELRELLSNPHHWIDYSLYSVLGVHCQNYLELNDDDFFERVSEATFLNYQDGQIKLAPLFRRNFVIRRMNREFKSWSRVNQIHVDEVKKGQDTFKIQRRTLPQYKEKLKTFFRGDEELVRAVLRRDCVQTEHSFSITFKKLYRQRDLTITTERSEADSIEEGEPYSQYLVQPSEPYRTLLTNVLFATGRGLRTIFLPWWDNYLQRKELADFRDEAMDRENSIGNMTNLIKGQYAELQERQQVVVKLLEEISKLRASGERHGLRNYLQRVRDKEDTIIRGQVRDQLSTTYILCKDDPALTLDLEKLIEPFQMELEDLRDLTRLNKKLKDVVVEEVEFSADGKDSIIPKTDLDPELGRDFLEAFSNLVENEIYLDKAYAAFLESKTSIVPKSDNSPWSNFDPFQALYTLRTIREAIRVAEERISSLGTVDLLKSVELAQAFENGALQAQKDKNVKISLHKEFEFNPFIVTDRVTLEHMFRDLVYNSIDAGATHIEVATHIPIRDLVLPHLEELNLPDHPKLYFKLSDNGKGMSLEKAAQLNAYFSGVNIPRKTLSTKIQPINGGQGSENLRTLLRPFGGGIYYEPNEKEGITLHLYLARLGF